MGNRVFFYDRENGRILIGDKALKMFQLDSGTERESRHHKRSFFQIKDGNDWLFVPAWDSLKACSSMQSDLCLSCKWHHALPEKSGGCRILTEGQSLEYPFILIGVEQVRYGKTIRLFILECSRYKKAEERPVNPKKRENLFLHEEDMETFYKYSSLFGTKHLL